MSEGPMELTPLAQKAIAQIQQKAAQEINEVLQMDAEAQGIDLNEYRFNQQAGVWVPTQTEAEDVDG